MDVLFDVVLEMIFVFVVWLQAVYRWVRPSYMVVVCLSEQLMRKISSANLRSDRFASGSCSTTLTPWLFLFHFSESGYVVCGWRESKRSVLSGSPCFVPRSRWYCLLLTSVCAVARCWS